MKSDTNPIVSGSAGSEFLGSWKGNLGGKIEIALGRCQLKFSGVNGLRDGTLTGLTVSQGPVIVVVFHLEAAGVDPATKQKVLRYSYDVPMIHVPVWLRSQDTQHGAGADWGDDKKEFFGTWTADQGREIVLTEDTVKLTGLDMIEDGTYRWTHSKPLRAILVTFPFTTKAVYDNKKHFQYDPPVELEPDAPGSTEVCDPTETETYEEDDTTDGGELPERPRG